MLSVVKMTLKGEVGGHALNSHGNYIVDHEKSLKNHGIVFLNFLGSLFIVYSGVRSEKLSIGGSKPTGKVADVLQLVRPKVPTDDDTAWSFPHDTDNGDSDSMGKSTRSPAKKKVRLLILSSMDRLPNSEDPDSVVFIRVYTALLEHSAILLTCIKR